MVKYEGLFFDEENLKKLLILESHPLPFINDEIHLTFKYRPTKEEIFNNLVGKKFTITVVGYGYDSFNSGFKVILPKRLEKYYLNYDEEDPSKKKVAHITTSIAFDGKGVNTKNLNFVSLVKPIKITGTFGLWIEENNKEFLSFKKYHS